MALGGFQCKVTQSPAHWKHTQRVAPIASLSLAVFIPFFPKQLSMRYSLERLSPLPIWIKKLKIKEKIRSEIFSPTPGRLYDKGGTLRQWWSDTVVAQFKNKTQCIIEQYNNYSYPHIPHLNINGKNTQGENIADNGGIKEAFWWVHNMTWHDMTWHDMTWQ